MDSLRTLPPSFSGDPYTYALALFALILVSMLSLARQHALDRVQFGKPIAGFQAVRHRLAETLVAIEGAEATLLLPARTRLVGQALPDDVAHALGRETDFPVKAAKRERPVRDGVAWYSA